MANRVFIAGTGQNEGKTTVSLGLVDAFQKSSMNVGFIKPVGQRYVESGGYQVDEDSVLIESACGLDCHLKDMSPIAIVHGLTKRYIDDADSFDLENQIVGSLERVQEKTDIVVIEGTGHAGVGSVIDLSNASVARMLQAAVIIVTGGGIGRPIDEVSLNRTFFDANGVPIIGVILNRVFPSKLDSVAGYVRKGLSRQNLKLLGTIPYEPILSGPSIAQILEDTDSELLHGEECLANLAEKIIIGAMSPHMALEYFRDNVLLITPGDREDLILTAIASGLLSGEPTPRLAGIVLTGGIFPHKNIIRIIRRTQIPVLLMEDDSYTAASKIHDLIVKIRPCDTRKIELAKTMVRQYVDVEGILKSL